MPSKIPNEGEIRLAERALSSNLELRLFVNNLTPVDASVLADFTEMSTHGYAAKTLTGGSWSVSTVSGKAEASYAQQTFSFTAATAVLVYGYYIVDTGAGKVVQAERFASPQTIELLGDAIRITPKITFATES